jgi:hypothetical protein
MLIAASAHAANGRHSVARKLLCECTEVVRACGETAAGWSGVFGSNLAVAGH